MKYTASDSGRESLAYFRATVGLSFTHLHGMINHWLHLILYFWGGFVLFSATATYQVLLSTILLYFYWCFLEFPIPKSQIRQPAKKQTKNKHMAAYRLLLFKGAGFVCLAVWR